MRSQRGFWAVVVLLLAVPAAVLSGMFFPEDETVIHVGLGLGFVMISLAVFDFEAPGWATWVGSLASGAIAGIFFLQAASELIPNDALYDLAYGLLGQGAEGMLLYGFVFWCAAMLLSDSRDKSRVFGSVAVSLVIALGVYMYSAPLFGYEAAEVLKVLFILPVVWLLLESKKAGQPEVSPSRVLMTAG